MPITINRDTLFTPTFRALVGRGTLYVAISSFFIHLLIYFVYTYQYESHPEKLLANPINAIYTPFSFLLVYEAYLLLYYLPQSTTIYIGKQYEIISLILIRGIFKDITYLDLATATMENKYVAELWYDLATVLLVFGMILIFYKISNRFGSATAQYAESGSKGPEIKRFISAKKTLSFLLLLLSAALGVYALVEWLFHASLEHHLQPGIDINGIFFDQFFSLLIIGDVVILLLSLFYTDDFALIIRNSSFVISTILLKLSFSANGAMEQVFILVGVAFGVAMYAVSSRFTR